MRGTIKRNLNFLDPVINRVTVVLKASLFITACLMAFPATNLLAATYYVATTGNDSNPGTQADPWQTMAKAASAALVPGDTVLFANGTYQIGASGISFTSSGTVGNPITFQAQNKQQAILQMNNNQSQGVAIKASYVTLDGFHFIAGTFTQFAAASYYVVRCFESGGQPNPGKPTSGNVGCVLRNSSIDYIPNFSGGAKTNQDASLFENNTIHMGIEAFNNLGTIFRNNIIYSTVPQFQGQGIATKGGTRNTQIYNNVIHRSGQDLGLNCGGSSGATWMWLNNGIEAYNCVAYNNVIRNEGSISNNVELLGCYGCQDSKIVNNVVIGGGVYTGKGGIAPGVMTAPINVTFNNNIIVGISNEACVQGWGGIIGTVTFDYNNFYNCTGTPSQAHPITGDPQFINPQSDWQLNSGSPAIGAGVPVSFTGYSLEPINVSLDKQGVTRTVPWNLGLYGGTTTANAPPSPPIGLAVR